MAEEKAMSVAEFAAYRDNKSKTKTNGQYGPFLVKMDKNNPQTGKAWYVRVSFSVSDEEVS